MDFDQLEREVNAAPSQVDMPPSGRDNDWTWSECLVIGIVPLLAMSLLFLLLSLLVPKPDPLYLSYDDAFQQATTFVATSGVAIEGAPSCHGYPDGGHVWDCAVLGPQTPTGRVRIVRCMRQGCWWVEER
jgi:hypothetical protein